MKYRRSAAIGFAAVLTGGAVLAGSGTAASASTNQCDQGLFCVWTDINYEGEFGGTRQADSNWGDVFGPFTEFLGAGGINDEDSSIWNRWDNYAATIFKNKNYNDKVICTDRGASRACRRPPCVN